MIYLHCTNNQLEKLKSQDDMYNSVKDNTLIKEIEDVFDAKIDKDNISKL